MSFQFQSAVFYGVGVRSFAHVGGQIESVEGVSSSVVVIVDDQSSVAVVHVHGLVQQAQDFCISAPVSKVWGKGCFMGEGLIVGGQGQVVEAKVPEVERVFSTAAVESGVGDQSQETLRGSCPMMRFSLLKDRVPAGTTKVVTTPRLRGYVAGMSF